jgi:hypothetical protein
MVADDIHAELQAMPLNNEEDMPRYQRTLADYADYTIYVALMKRQLDQLMPGAGIDDYTAILDKCYGASPIRDVFKETVNQEMDSEIALLRKQYRAASNRSPALFTRGAASRHSAPPAHSKHTPCDIAPCIKPEGVFDSFIVCVLLSFYVCSQIVKRVYLKTSKHENSCHHQLERWSR